MSSVNSAKLVNLQPQDIVPGDWITTVWRWCLRNEWTFIADPKGDEPFVDPRCAAAYCNPGCSYKSSQNTILKGVRRYVGGTVRISEVVAKSIELAESES